MRIFENDQIDSFLKDFFDKREEDNEEIREQVSKILADVKSYGDIALRKYTLLFDKVDIEDFEVSRDEMTDAKVSPNLYEALVRASENIRSFHEKQREEAYELKRKDGSLVGLRINPIERVGVYVPAGSAPLPSSVLMNVIPAKVAGVKEIIMLSPPRKDGSLDPSILVAAKIAGVDRIFKLGGTQAIGALAYGTETIPKVYKITGPGNAYVAKAKEMVFGKVGIDMIAGPSEILIVANNDANPSYIAADLLSQAEHDPLSSSILITWSKQLAEQVSKEVERMLIDLERGDIARASIDSNGAILIVDSIKEAAKYSNKIAPEHLELLLDDDYMELFTNAGAIFLGNYSPEPMGDYFAGTNHVLPTRGTGVFSSPLGVWDFVKRTSYIKYTKEGFLDDSKYALEIAEAEGLSGHANSLRVRWEDE